MTKNEILKAKLPSCWKLITDDRKPDVFWIDFWTATPSGDDFTDYCCGDCHGAEVIRYARETCRPEWVDCTILWMTYLLSERGSRLNPPEMLERGFLDRVCHDD